MYNILPDLFVFPYILYWPGFETCHYTYANKVVKCCQVSQQGQQVTVRAHTSVLNSSKISLSIQPPAHRNIFQSANKFSSQTHLFIFLVRESKAWNDMLYFVEMDTQYGQQHKSRIPDHYPNFKLHVSKQDILQYIVMSIGYKLKLV